MRLRMAFGITIVACGLCLSAWAQEADGADAEAPAISADFPFEENYVEVLGSKMHYVDVGEGDPVIFLHGNPTSSYLWRNVIPHVQPHARCIAPDLIGFGKSDKPDIEYTFFDHVKYITGFIEALDLKNITLVIHDWGSGIGFEYAMAHEDNVKGVAFMEAFVQPFATWEELPAFGRPIFKTMRTPEVGWNFVVKNNAFVEQLLPGAVLRKLSEEEMNHYRAPFLEEAARKPVWVWPNQVPIAGEPADVAAALDAYNKKLQASDLPKLMFTATPGFLLGPDRAQWCRDHLTNLTEVDLGPGAHFVQEDHPDAIGQAVADWYQNL